MEKYEFGYPECCIKDFFILEKRHFRIAIGFRTGFVPCFKCAFKIFNGEIDGLDKLISGRTYPHPFPISHIESGYIPYFDSKIARKAYEDNKTLLEKLLHDTTIEEVMANYRKLVPLDWDLDKALELHRSTNG